MNIPEIRTKALELILKLENHFKFFIDQAPESERDNVKQLRTLLELLPDEPKPEPDSGTITKKDFKAAVHYIVAHIKYADFPHCTREPKWGDYFE